jgi:hypothetical protein
MSIPDGILEGLINYRDKRIPTGGFLWAVLANDLSKSFARADSSSLAALQDIIQFVWWEMPSVAWGSPEKVDAWLAATP